MATTEISNLGIDKELNRNVATAFINERSMSLASLSSASKLSFGSTIWTFVKLAPAAHPVGHPRL